MRRILTTRELEEESGLSMLFWQSEIRAGRLLAIDISEGKKRANYRVRREDFEAYLTPKNAPKPAPTTNERLSQRRRRLDANVPKVI